MTLNQAVILAKKMIENHKELKGWRIVSNRRKRAFGVCNYTYRQIELSAYLIPECTDKSIKDTIIHEIAHALCPGHNHDRVWQMKCVELGGNGQRCGGADNYKEGKVGSLVLQEKLAKYTLTCPVCDAVYHKNRKTTKVSSCGKHGRVYDPKYKLTVTQNY